jgi:hypothetical protein
VLYGRSNHFSNSTEDHQKHLTKLLEVLSRENTFIRRKMCLGLPVCSFFRLHSRQQRTSNGSQEGTFNYNDAVPEGTRGNKSFSRTHRVLPETHRWICENSNTFSLDCWSIPVDQYGHLYNFWYIDRCEKSKVLGNFLLQPCGPPGPSE